MTTLSPTERAVIRHLSTSEPMPIAKLSAVADLDQSIRPVLASMQSAELIEPKPIRSAKGHFTGRYGYILTRAGADLCEAMERERAFERANIAFLNDVTADDTSDLHAIAAQATREHGEPDGDALIALAMQSPRFFSPPVKPSLWARVKARLGLAA